MLTRIRRQLARAATRRWQSSMRTCSKNLKMQTSASTHPWLWIAPMIPVATPEAALPDGLSPALLAIVFVFHSSGLTDFLRGAHGEQRIIRKCVMPVKWPVVEVEVDVRTGGQP
jgi:hypothetical protein